MVPAETLEDSMPILEDEEEAQTVTTPRPLPGTKEGDIMERMEAMFARHVENIDSMWQRRQEEFLAKEVGRVEHLWKRKDATRRIDQLVLHGREVAARKDDESVPDHFDEDDDEPGDEDYGPDPEPDLYPIPDEDEEEPEDELVPEPETEPLGPQPTPSPPDDPATFGSLIQRVGKHFQLDMAPQVEPTSYFLAKLGPAMSTPAALPMEPSIWNIGRKLLQTPATLPASSARQEKKYRVPNSAPLCLRGIPPPDSVVATAARQGSKQPGTLSTVPPDKEGRKLDAAGKKVMTTAAIAVKGINSTAFLARYDRDMWDGMGDLIRYLPPDKRKEAEVFLAEGRLAADNGLRASMDVADSCFRMMGQGVAMRRQAWLNSATLTQDLQNKIVNTPFDGEVLFGKTADKALQDLKEDVETYKGIPGTAR